MRPRALGLCASLALALLPGPTALRAAAAAAPVEEATGGPAAQLDELMRLLAARRQGHVSFTEVQVLAVLQQPLQSSGELLYQAPDRLEKRTLKPRPEALLLAGDVLTISRAGRTRSFELARHPEVLPWVECMRATLAGDRATLQRYFQVDFTGALAHWRLVLVPLGAASRGGIASVRIDGSGAALRQVEIRQRDGDHSLMTLGPELPP